MRHVLNLCTATLLISPVLLAQSGGAAPEQPPAQRPAATAARVSATGCVAQAADGSGLVLRDVESAPGTVDSGQTSPAAGTSATGDAPSGSVTGRTPTGSTADVTPAPTPDAGTPGEAASPASPVFRQPSAAGTTGTVAGSDTPAREYRLVPGHGVDLREHIGHTVQVEGAVRPAGQGDAARARQGEVPGQAAQMPAESGRNQDGAAVVQTLVVERLRHLRPTCAP